MDVLEEARRREWIFEGQSRMLPGRNGASKWEKIACEIHYGLEREGHKQAKRHVPKRGTGDKG